MIDGLTEQQTVDRLKERAQRAFPRLAACEQVRSFWVGSAGVVDRLRVVGSIRDAKGDLVDQIEVSVPMLGSPSLVFDRGEPSHERTASVRVKGERSRKFVEAARTRVEAPTVASSSAGGADDEDETRH